MILIVYAHEPEVRSLRRLTSESSLESRVDWRRFRTASDRLFVAGGQKPDLVLNLGYAGRLNPELQLGDVVLVGKIGDARAGARPVVLSESIMRHAVDRRIRQVALTTSAEPVVDEAARTAVRDLTGADIVDMEAFFIMAQASAARVPFVSLKLVSDHADGDAWNTIKRSQAQWSSRLGRAAHDFMSIFVEDGMGNTVGR